MLTVNKSVDNVQIVQKKLDIPKPMSNYIPMTGYTKLFGSILTSTIWRESKETKLLWITMLALANKQGVVEASLPGLADMARITLDECKAGLAALEAPDPYSRTKEHEGRRVEEVDGGWRLLNYLKYRDKLSNIQAREYFKLKKRQYREESKTVQNVQDNPRQSKVASASASASASEERKEEGVQGKGEGKPAVVHPAPVKSNLDVCLSLEVPEKLRSPEFLEAWPRWLKYRLKVKAVKAPEAMFSGQLKWLAKHCDAAEAVESMEASMRNGWQGLFPPKAEPQTQNHPGGPIPNASRGQVGEARERQEEIKGIKIITIGPEGEKIRYT